jgi:hypothetical protein
LTLAQRIVEILIAGEVGGVQARRLAARVLREVRLGPGLDGVEPRAPTAEALARDLEGLSGVWRPSWLRYSTKLEVRQAQRLRQKIEEAERELERLHHKALDRSRRDRPRQAVCVCGGVIEADARTGRMRCGCGEARVAPIADSDPGNRVLQTSLEAWDRS